MGLMSVAAVLVVVNPRISSAAPSVETGSLKGTVISHEGRPASHAIVEVHDYQTRRLITATRADENGFFKFDDLRVGQYIVYAELPRIA
jgi:hypothetical protein